MKELELWIPKDRTFRNSLPQGLETILFEPEISSTFIILQVFPLSLDIRTSAEEIACWLCLLWRDSLYVAYKPLGIQALKQEPLPEAHSPGRAHWQACRSELRSRGPQ